MPEPDFGAYAGMSGTSSLASQLNKLSLDNNLTDIEEDENENFTARRDLSPKSATRKISSLKKNSDKNVVDKSESGDQASLKCSTNR